MDRISNLFVGESSNANKNFVVGESSSINNNFDESSDASNHTHREWIKEFDRQKVGIKWLSENLTFVPGPFYIQSPLRTMFAHASTAMVNLTPIISMRLSEPELVDKIKKASLEFGYFQIVDHSVPLPTCDQLLAKMREFYDEQIYVETAFYYGRSTTYDKGAYYNSTHDLYEGQDPTWHDTLMLRLGPDLCDSIPTICKTQVLEWNQQVSRLAIRIANLFAIGLGRHDDPFASMLGRIGFFGNFYPRCRDSDPRIVGFQPHTDPCLFTILLQDDSGGLKGLYNKKWYDIKPIRGALVVFVGDLLEILSNGAYESGIHYVKTSQCARPRVSVAQTFTPANKNRIYKPITKGNEPIKFNPVDITAYVNEFFASKLTIKTMVNKYKSLPPIHQHRPEPDTELCLGPRG